MASHGKPSKRSQAFHLSEIPEYRPYHDICILFSVLCSLEPVSALAASTSDMHYAQSLSRSSTSNWNFAEVAVGVAVEVERKEEAPNVNVTRCSQ